MKYTEEYIRNNKNSVNWTDISRYQKLSEDFIREFKDSVNWADISMCQKLSEDFIREFKDSVNWTYISRYQKFSEDFIREFKNSVDWTYISMYQKLSEDFIREFKDSVNWTNISNYQKLSEEFIREFNLTIDEDNWLYKNKEYKLEQLKRCGVYKIQDDYVLAYKSTRNGYSVFNYQYYYEVGKTYESHCDHTSEINSFGISAWTKEKASSYYDGELYLVKIMIDDIGRVVEDYKIRTNKITIVSRVDYV